MSVFEICRISQDHLEQLFGAVRSRSGYNPRPTSRQFMSSYKSLLLDAEIKIADGNTELLDFIPILNPPPKVMKVTEIDEDENEISSDIVFETNEFNLDFIILNGLHRNDIQTVSTIGLAAGMIMKTLKLKIKCISCANAIKSEYRVDAMVMP